MILANKPFEATKSLAARPARAARCSLGYLNVRIIISAFPSLCQIQRMGICIDCGNVAGITFSRSQQAFDLAGSFEYGNDGHKAQGVLRLVDRVDRGLGSLPEHRYSRHTWSPER